MISVYLLEGILQTIKLIYTIQLNKPSFSRRQTSLLLQCPHLSTIKTKQTVLIMILS